MTTVAKTAGGTIAAPEPTLTVASEHANTLRWWADRNYNHGPLLPLETLKAAQAELEAAMAARPPAAYGDLAASRLIGSFPQRGPAVPDFYVANLAAVMREYPGDVVRDASLKLIRGNKFLPAIAEFVEAADAIMGDRRLMLIGARRQEKAHAEREAQRLADEKQAVNRLAWIARAETSVADKFRDLVPTDRIHAYGEAGLRSLGTINAALTWGAVLRGEVWAVQAWRRAIVLNQVAASHLTVAEFEQIIDALADWREADALALARWPLARPTSVGMVPDELLSKARQAVSREACTPRLRPVELSADGAAFMEVVFEEMRSRGIAEEVIAERRAQLPPEYWNQFAGVRDDREWIDAVIDAVLADLAGPAKAPL
jgi:hypothetical protein